MRRSCRRLVLPALAVLLAACLSAPAPEPAKTGPATEKRFPPLKVPAGFQATLFACDPLVEYPSVIAPGFQSGTLLVAIDYMTGLGSEIERRDEIRLLEDTDNDGYADRATVFASGFNSIQGLAQHDGVVYVMHAPYLSALRDTKGTGKADERRDLITGLGLPPEEDPVRLHNANGVVVGHDGWLYLALGDRGCRVVRPEGDKLVLEEGGILRCRPDGRDLHVFSSGLRNIYDVAMDEELNVFVRDNENDGGTYKVRLCQSFFGADHGYPYLYEERPDEALRPLADLGLGAPAGGVCYLEQQFPPEYRGNLFFCEWGRAVVRSPLKRAGASFRALKEEDFIAGAANDPYGFRPTDLVVDRDGSMFVSDWCDGQRPRRGRGRIYRIRYTGSDAKLDSFDIKSATLDQLIRRLDSESYLVRREAQEALEGRGREALAVIHDALKKEKIGAIGRLHAVWIVAKVQERDAINPLLDLAGSDADARVRAQALRAVADLTDPVSVRHRLDAGPGDDAIARKIADLITKENCDPRIQLEAVLALGRLRWNAAPNHLKVALKSTEPALAHAAQWALRRSANWPALLQMLDESSDVSIRSIARRALAGQFAEEVVDGLIDRLKREPDSSRRQEYADLLTRVFKKPAPWVYWGFRPAPRPPNTVAWQRTDSIAQALNVALVQLDSVERTVLLRRMAREKIPATGDALASTLRDEYDADRVGVILAALAEAPIADALPSLERIARDRKHTSANRLAATTAYARRLPAKDVHRLLATAEAVEDGPVLAELLRAVGTQKVPDAITFVAGKTTSTEVEVRIRAVEALGDLGNAQAKSPVEKRLDDTDPRVRAAAARAAGKLSLTSAANRLLELARDPDAKVRAASLIALRLLGERRALTIAVNALSEREVAPAALEYIAALGGPEQTVAVSEVAHREPSVEMLEAVGRVLTGWRRRDNLKHAEREVINRAFAKLHGSSGTLLAWRIRGLSREDADALVKSLTTGGLPAGTSEWPVALSIGTEARLRLGPAKNPADVWLADTNVEVPDATPVELFAASNGLETIWLNEKVVFQRDKLAASSAKPDRMEANLAQGSNRILVRLRESQADAEFQLRFRRKSAAPERERFAAAALSQSGNAGRGRQVFLNAEKSQCIKCHRVGDTGERHGPELTGLGSRFSRVHIIESILEPSRTISPSYESLVVNLTNGRSVTGLKIEETDVTLVLLDAQAKKHVVARADIEGRRKSVISPMPDGLEKTLSIEEFFDLIAYLVSLKSDPVSR